MSYKDKQKQKQAQHESYLRNKEITKERSKQNKSINKIRNGRFVSKYKTLCGCLKCGYNINPITLDFHHVTDNKVDGISRMVRHVKLNKLKKEIRKCVVLCSNCHRLVHANIIKI